MKISLNWLQDFIEITEQDHEKIKDIITANTAEVETMESQGDHLDKIVVAKVTELKKHPNADRLRVTKVYDGQETYNVVCGGSNLREDMTIAFAKIGAVISWHDGEKVEMKKTKIRGEESNGMICASHEIGLAEMFPRKKEKEIIDLTPLNLTIGQPLAKALNLNDAILDVDNHAITNRSDLFSHHGFAREFVANGLGKWKKIKEVKLPENNSPEPIEVVIEEGELCPRYMAVYMTGIEVMESPEWIKKRLIACGINPISNMVDITNYVMLELGMPLHAFDYDQLKGEKWTVRKSKQGEKMVTLDGQEHELMEDVVVIDDGHELVDLCGIMGGFSCKINEKTEKVWLHAPVFHPSLVRRAMRGLGHISDASTIYEKGVDLELAEKGLKRAMEIILECCPNAKVASKVMDLRANAKESRTIQLRKTQVDKLIGVEMEAKKVEKILSDLGFETKPTKEGHDVNIPSFRLNDVNMEADLVEEIARIYGYDNLPYLLPEKPITPIPHNHRRRREREVRNKLAGFGLSEIYTFAFLGPELLEKTGMKVSEDMIELENPISSDLSLMRTSLLPRTLDTVEQNLRYRNEVNVFELSRVYRNVKGKPQEKTALIIAMTGDRFKEVQGMVEELGLTLLPARDKATSVQHPGRFGQIMLRGKNVGYLYELHPQILKNFDIKTRVTVAEIDFEAIHEMNIQEQPKYKAIPRYPSVNLDVSVLAGRKQLSQELVTAIKNTDKVLISDAVLIDEYVGENIPKDKRALTYSIKYQAMDRTLTDREVSQIHEQVLKKLEGKGVEIRK